MLEITDASGGQVRDGKSFKIETKNYKKKLWKVQVLLPGKHKHRFDVEQLILIKERSKLIWRFIFFEIIVKKQMCKLFLFKKIKDARLFSNS